MKLLRWLTAVFLSTLFILYLGGSWFFSSVIIEAPTRPVDTAYAWPETADGIRWEGAQSITLTNDDVQIAGSYFDNPQENRCATLILHGYTSHRFDMVPFANIFWQYGCDLLLIDARGHGASSPAFHTYGYFEKQDTAVAYDWLRQQTGLPPSRVGIFGASYGAATAVQTLDLRNDIGFVVADSPYQDWQTIVMQQGVSQYGGWVRLFVPGAFGVTAARTGARISQVSPEEAIADNQTPVLLIHAREDSFTAVSHSEAIFANANPASTTLQITDWGADHNQSHNVDYDAYTALITTFLDGVLE